MKYGNFIEVYNNVKNIYMYVEICCKSLKGRKGWGDNTT